MSAISLELFVIMSYAFVGNGPLELFVTVRVRHPYDMQSLSGPKKLTV